MNPINQIVQGDCVQLLKSLPDAGVDLVVTDPPYLVNYRDCSGPQVCGAGRPVRVCRDVGRVRDDLSGCRAA